MSLKKGFSTMIAIYLHRRWRVCGGLALMAALLLPCGRLAVGEQAPTDERDAPGAAKSTDRPQPKPPTETPPGVKRVREKETTTVTRTTEEEVVPEGTLPREPETEEQGNEPRPFGSNFFDPDADTDQPLPQAVVPADYPLGPGDTLELTFWSDFIPQETHELRVDGQGQLALPEGGTLSVRGLTLDRVQELAQALLARLYKQVKVHVALVKLRTIRVWVGGEVQRVGTQILSPMSTVFNALHAAGGPNDIGSLRRIRLTRAGRQLASIDLYDYLLTGDAQDDLSLESGDRLFVPVVGPQVTVVGEVRRPAIYELTGGEKLSEVLRWAGGLKASGYARRLQVTRIEENARRVVRDVEALALLRAPTADNDFPLQAGDVVRVYPVVEQVRNSVRIEGQVHRGGEYEWRQGMRVKDLVELAEGLLEDANRKRGELVRQRAEGGLQMVAFDVAAAMAGDAAANLELQPQDRVILYSTTIEGFPVNVSVRGAVQRPGTYRHYAGMRVRDLLNWAGGVRPDMEVVQCMLERVYPPVAPVFRAEAEGDKTPSTEVVPARLTTPKEVIHVEGRVARPGDVELVKGKDLSYYLQQAGEVLSDADPRGIQVYRGEGETLPGDPALVLEAGDRIFVPAVLSASESPETARALLEAVAPDQRTANVMLDLEGVLAGDLDWNVLLRPGDRVTLHTPASLRWLGGYVRVEGEVVRPGLYERAEGMTVADLLFKADGLLPDAHRTRASLERRLPDGETELKALDLQRVRDLNPEDNLVLQDQDRLIVYRRDEIEHDRRRVRIQGAVQSPGDYPRTRGMRLSDLLYVAGGLLPEANQTAEIVRLDATGGRRHRLFANLALLRAGDEGQDVILQDFDSVSIATVYEDRRLAASVTVAGEVAHPGVYYLTDENTSLSEVLKLAGGPTDNAYLPGATIRRQVDRLLMEHQRATMQTVQRESNRMEAKEYLATTAADLTTPLPGEATKVENPRDDLLAPIQNPLRSDYTYVPVDFGAALSQPGSEVDVALREGDTISIPPTPVYVFVVGAVVRPVTLYYDGPHPLSHYIRQAGNFSKDARKDQLEVIRADGSVLPAKDVRTIQAGDIIFVPSQALIYREKKSWLDILQSMSPLLSLAVLATR